MSLAELDAPFQAYGYPAEIALEGMEGNMMRDDYTGSTAYERQSYHEHY